jgi:ABC-type nitrate/sulfonate/bicarbonate transport system substrate-binding protein
MGRRTFILVGLCLLILAAVAAFILTQRKVEPELVVVMAPFTSHRVATYALENRLIDVSSLPPLKVETTYEFNEAMLALRGDVGEMSTEAFAVAYERDTPLRIISAWVITGNEIGNYLVFTKKNSTINKASDLAKAKIGIPSPRGLKTCNLVFLEVMKRKFNVTLDISSPSIIDKPLPQLPSLLDGGQVDAILTIGDVSAQLMLQPDKYQLLYDVSSGFKELYGEYPIASVVVAKSALLESKPEAVKGVLKALRSSYDYGLSHRDDAVRWAVEKTGAKAEAALELLKQCKYSFTLSDREKEAILRILNLAYEEGLIKVRPDPTRIFASLEG